LLRYSRARSEVLLRFQVLYSTVESSISVREDLKREIVRTIRIGLDLVRRLQNFERETRSLLNALSGGYVEPGPSGSLTRGKISILPTGRNFYAVDPRSIPTRAAWEVGVKCCREVLRKYYERHGRYPESIGFVLWSIDAYKADGEEISEILYLLGVRPVWDSCDNVVDLEVIPLEELGRPRIDVTVRISGIVRDTLPNYIHLIDKAVELVANLDEPPDKNFIRKHYLEFVTKLGGLYGGEGRELALCRVFAEPPGAYGAGVNYAVEASAWRDLKDLGKVWMSWSCYAYTRKFFGRPAPEALVLNLSKVDAVVRNNPSDEHDIFGCCCYFAYHGGFYSAVRTLKRDVDIYQVDTSDISRIAVRDIEEEIERIARSKILNERWIEEMKKHGYAGASEFARKILHVYGWASTTMKVKDWIFDEIAEKYVLNDDMRRWFLENNKYALEEIARRLVEAAERGLWRPSEDVLDKLREAYAEVEASLEDEVSEDVQGGEIDVVAPGDDENYGRLVSDIEKALSLLKSENAP